MKTDIQTLRQSWSKYKNKNGKKAQRLKMKIEAHIGFAKLIKQLNTTRNSP